MSECKNCGKSLPYDYAERFDYCPDCIAKGFANSSDEQSQQNKEPDSSSSSELSSPAEIENSNVVSGILYVIGVIIIIIGFVLCIKDWGQYYTHTVPLLYVLGGTISGMFFVGLGEIISLLQKILNK